MWEEWTKGAVERGPGSSGGNVGRFARSERGEELE